MDHAGIPPFSFGFQPLSSEQKEYLKEHLSLLAEKIKLETYLKKCESLEKTKGPLALYQFYFNCLERLGFHRWYDKVMGLKMGDLFLAGIDRLDDMALLYRNGKITWPAYRECIESWYMESVNRLEEA